MTSLYLVDPDLQETLSVFQPLHLAAETLVGARAEMLADPVQPGSDGTVQVEVVLVPGAAGAPDVRVLLYRPVAPASPEAPRAALLHIHGGGFVMGSADRSDFANRGRAAALDCVVVSVGYRLAPETPFPGAIGDCFAVLAWLHEQAGALGIDPARIGLVGESAGGGLAAALALMARDKGGPAIAFQHLIFPMLDDRTCVKPDPSPFQGEFVWTAGDNHFGWSSLLGGEPGGPGTSPYAAAARAETLEGLPPTYVAVGSLDLFLEENLAYAKRLARAGVPIELQVYPGAFHAFQMVVAAGITRRANADSLAALRRALAAA